MYLPTDANSRCLFSVVLSSAVQWLQLFTCCLLSVGQATASVQIAANSMAIMLSIYQQETVNLESPITIRLRAISGVGMALGTLLAGWRLVPVSGKSAQLISKPLL